MPSAPTDSSARWTRFAGRRGWALVGGVALAHGVLLWGAGVYQPTLTTPPEPVTVLLASVLPVGAAVPLPTVVPAPPARLAPAKPTTAAPVEAVAQPTALPPQVQPPKASPPRDARLAEPVLAIPLGGATANPAPAPASPSPPPSPIPSLSVAGSSPVPVQTDAVSAKTSDPSSAGAVSVAPSSGLSGGKVELPSSDASYLQNPRPEYPRISRQRGEQGRVLVRVLIGTDGNAQKAEISQSSGFSRLDQSALNAVSNWRFVPGKRNGVPEAMWFTVPVGFCLSADGVQCQP